MIITLAAEGMVDVATAIRLCEHVGHTVDRAYPQGGKDKLDRQFASYNRAARFTPWLVLRDLDHDADCAPSLRRILPQPSEFMLLRIAVRSVESWLLADGPSFADYFSVPALSIPLAPDELPDPKRTVLELVAKSRMRSVRDAMLPNADLKRTVGIRYSLSLIDFVQTRWQVHIAKKVSPSLDRCVSALGALGSTANR